MASKKQPPKDKTGSSANAEIEGAGIVADELITDTIRSNFMPYAMSVIVSRALPEIDGFKPSHRKLLYTMYKMGLLTGVKTKSANIVGQTMKLNPHGDAAIYETMVRLARGNETLLHPYVDSKGNFGKAYSRNMAYAAARYTEAKLSPICAEFFGDIDKDTVDFMPNYDNTTTEPTLFPASFPSVLVNSNVGIAVSMASNVCSFNLAEVCETAIALIKNPNHDIISTLKGPDFAGGGYIVYDEAELQRVYATGRGSVKIRCKYEYNKPDNCLEITQIPPTTTIEAIIEKIVELIKSGKIKEISYIRDETDKSGLKIAIDLKKNTDPEKLMQKLFRFTPLQDNYPCNFNILIAGMPRVMGIAEILDEWTAFRKECVKRRVYFDLKRKEEKLHLLKGLKKILLDIDKAIKIVRETEEENDVVPNLMIGFGIDEIQAEYVAEIKLRHLNRQYILNRIQEIEQLEKDIAEMKDILSSDAKIKNIIIAELKEVIRKYSQPRKTLFIYAEEAEEYEPEDDTPDYPVTLFVSRSGYFKKIVPLSLRMNSEQKLKEGDSIIYSAETGNRAELLFFSDKCQVYKAKASQFDDTKASALGDYVPAKLGFDDGELLHSTVVTTDYSGFLVMIFDNGKVAKVPLSAYETKTNRKKLANAYTNKARLVKLFHIPDNADILIRDDAGYMLVFNTALIMPKSTRDTIGVQVKSLNKKAVVENAYVYSDELRQKLGLSAVNSIPKKGSSAAKTDDPDQLTF